MTKILFDHQIFSWQRYGGISRYFANIHHHIQELDNVESEIGSLYSENYYINDLKGILSNGVGKLLLSKASRRNKWNKQYSKYLIKKGDFDILHPTYYDPYFLKKVQKPYVITVHDMIHELLPSYFHPSDAVPYHKRCCIEGASHIIAISETTKTDLINILNVPEERITVIHHGYDIRQEVKYDSPDEEINYLLYVGDRAGYKNFSTFVTAIAPLLRETDKLQLICAGGGQFQSAENELLTRLQISQVVKQISATEEQLNALYANAIAFVFPSLYEGFGLPILEAFQYNCPVIASETLCFREVLGDAGLYFDPESHQEIRSSILDLLDHPSRREEFAAKGKQRLLQFSMKSCLEKTVDVYQKVH